MLVSIANAIPDHDPIDCEAEQDGDAFTVARSALPAEFGAVVGDMLLDGRPVLEVTFTQAEAGAVVVFHVEPGVIAKRRRPR